MRGGFRSTAWSARAPTAPSQKIHNLWENLLAPPYSESEILQQGLWILEIQLNWRLLSHIRCATLAEPRFRRMEGLTSLSSSRYKERQALSIKFDVEGCVAMWRGDVVLEEVEGEEVKEHTCCERERSSHKCHNGTEMYRLPRILEIFKLGCSSTAPT